MNDVQSIPTSIFGQLAQIVPQFDPSQAVIVEEPTSSTPLIIAGVAAGAIIVLFIVWRLKRRR